MKINIAIDGPSAAGKSTIANILAKDLGYAHLDTGAMYRCVGYLATCQKIPYEDETALAALIDQMEICFDEQGNVFINGSDVSKEIRTNEISMAASTVSAHPMVRERLVAKQQSIAKAKGYILDGRDIGTVVLPEAECKIYMIASATARAQRRYKEYVDKGISADYETIYQDIKRRDDQDMNRKTSPLKKAEDAIEIDTSTMSIEEVVNTIKGVLEEKINQIR